MSFYKVLNKKWLSGNSPIVKEFEEKWSRWQGIKYSVFVNSGSSANLLSMAILKTKFPNGGEVIVPPLTWVSDISSVIQNGFKPVFIDINPRTLAIDTKKTISKIIQLIENCESAKYSRSSNSIMNNDLNNATEVINLILKNKQ